LLHAHRDAAELAGKILSLLNDRTLAARLGAAGRSLIATKFSRRRTIDDMANLYHTMLAGRRRTAPRGTPGARGVREIIEGGD
jgi:hypothetical protein